MAPLYKNITRALATYGLMLFLVSCASYNQQISTYYEQVEAGNYSKAGSTIDHIKKLKRSRNRLLYLLEKGKMAHLQKAYEASNRYFNEADYFIEDTRTSAGDIALGTLLNPMMQTYKGEDFEKFMLHYYKALNYLYLDRPDEALVEARRISLQSYAQQDKANNRNNRYGDDAFSLLVQGIVYEKNNDVNNAFIAYRNAAELFLKHDNSYYGVAMPEQLKKDVVRTARLNGFMSEAERYEKLLNITCPPHTEAAGGELILFWENGFAPVKQEQNFYFALTKDGAGNFGFVDPTGAFNIPFDVNTKVNRDQLAAADLRSLRVAFPKYKEQPMHYQQAVLTVNSNVYTLEKAENINALAIATLKERFLKEMSLTLSRLAVKKLAEEAMRPKNDSAKNKDAREAMALAIQVFSMVSEKADTRNWQTLPHSIYYTRIPLQKGKNTVALQLNPGGQRIELTLQGTGRLQVQNICTLK